MYRLCSGCDGGYETAPVRSFVIKAAVANLALSAPSRAYAGYPVSFGVRAQNAPDGQRVVVERRSGSSWRAVAEATLTAGRAEAVGVLPRGTHAVRVVAPQGTEQVVGGQRSVAVVTARRWATARDGGRYAAGKGSGQPFSLRVLAGGRELRSF